MSCPDCSALSCIKGGPLPADCTTELCATSARENVIDLYLRSEVRTTMTAASKVAHAGVVGKWPRLKEVITFAHETGVERIGIASCSTYIKEVPMLAQILRDEGFEVVGAMCKMGSIRKSDVDLLPDPSQKDSVLCNPLMQAEALNNAGTDMNIVVGLCVGHDMLSTKNSEALCTTLVVRDQSLGGPKPFREALEGYAQ